MEDAAEKGEFRVAGRHGISVTFQVDTRTKTRHGRGKLLPNSERTMQSLCVAAWLVTGCCTVFALFSGGRLHHPLLRTSCLQVKAVGHNKLSATFPQ